MEISRKVDAKGRVMLPTYIHLNLKEFGIYLKKDEKKGKELAKKIVEIGDGRLYMVSNVDEIDKIILEDYYEIL